jgi:hypothetical protein
MNPSVYEYVYQGSDGRLVDIYGALTPLRSPALCGLAALAGAVVLLVAQRRQARAQSGGLFDRAAPIVPAVVLLVVYGLTWGHIEEVAINLEHPYNLYHFGKFSFSPLRMIDGTVEYAYYLLLTPFAASQTRLIAANFALGALIALGHLWILSKLFAHERHTTRLAVLLLFSLNFPIVSQLANGFGNSLVSLVFLGSIALHWRGRTTAAVMAASALPLLRPDAVLYSYAILFAVYFGDKDAWTWRRLSRLAWPAGALAAYLLIYRVSYGHWIPTPISFKSAHPGMVSPTTIKMFIIHLSDALLQPPQVIGLLAAAATGFFRDDPRVQFLRRLLLPMALVYVFYRFTRSLLGDYSGDAYARYWIGFEQTLFLCVSLALVRIAAAFEARNQWSGHTVVFGRLVPAAMVVFVAAGLASDGPRILRNRSGMAYAGQIAAAIVPAGLSISTTELHGFGLMVPGREIIDLWGYTQPDIAHSRLLNADRIRHDPAFFLSIQPDVFFPYQEVGDLSEMEAYLAQFHHFSKRSNLLGDMTKVLERYDVMLIRHPQRRVVLLVKRSSVAALRDSLEHLSYTVVRRRDIDLPKFRSLYDPQPLRQFPF